MTRCNPPILSGEYSLSFVSRRTGAAARLNGGSVSGKFTRTLDSTSTLELEISNGDECCPPIPTARVDEAVLTRNDSSKIAWVGPVTRIVDDQTAHKLSINAEDRSYWHQGAPVGLGGVIFAEDSADPVDIGYALWRHADAYEPSGLTGPEGVALVDFRPPAYGIAVGASYPAGSSAWEAIGTHAKTQMDWTVVGNELWWGGREIPVADGPELRKSRDWQSGSLVVDRDATSIVTQVVVVGAGGIRGVYPAVDVDAGYGRRTAFVQNTALNTAAEAEAQARFIYEANTRPSDFLVTGGGTLGASAPVCLHDLVPGRKFPVIADDGCLTSSEMLRLVNVVVSFQSGIGCTGGWALVETSVALDFARLGTQGQSSLVST